MTRIASLIFGFIAFFSFALPAYAADAVFFGPIVPNGTNGQPNCNCPGSAPDYGCVLQTLQNGINFVISIGFMLLILYIALAGFQFITSGGSAEARSAAKKRLMNVLVGILVVLSAWLIVDFVMKTLYGEDGRFGPWHAILREEGGENLCLEKTANPPPLPGVIGGVPDGGPSTGPTTGSGPNCPVPDPSSMVAFPASATQGETEMGTPTTVQNFVAMREAALKDGVDLKVTDGYRPESEQVALWNQYCSSGTCGSTKVAKPCSLGGSGSNHNSGQAIDINVGCSNGQSNCNTKAYQWLKANGSKWNFRNAIPTDPVHWSPSGR